MDAPNITHVGLNTLKSYSMIQKNIKDVLNIDNQESISKFLWDIRNIRVNSGSEC